MRQNPAYDMVAGMPISAKVAFLSALILSRRSRPLQNGRHDIF
ncbi:hypothetical protein SF83666_c06370 [Sinorhizobium fredii CCBAU 83666]|nr:hypothetical protein SF83666_c06370 [Sinorhizobium fredii CCBAU 83666]